MAHSTDIVGYTFKAETYCPEHIVDALTSTPEYEGWNLAEGVTMAVEDNLGIIAYHFGIDREAADTFDADEFPKVIFRDQAEDSYCATDGLPLI